MHDLPGLGLDAPRGQADDLDASELELLLSASVALEGGAGAVELVAVELDSEALRGPVDVDLLAGDEEVGEWGRQAGRTHEPEEPALELRAGEGGLAVGEERLAEPAVASVTTTSGKEGVDRREVEQRKPLRNLEGAVKPGRLEGGCQVEEGAGNAREGGAVMNRTVSGARAGAWCSLIERRG